MLFRTGEKFEIKKTDLLIDITASIVGAQGVRLDLGTQNFYRVTINGCETYISEEVLKMLVDLQEKEDETEEEVMG